MSDLRFVSERRRWALEVSEVIAEHLAKLAEKHEEYLPEDDLTKLRRILNYAPSDD